MEKPDIPPTDTKGSDEKEGEKKPEATEKAVSISVTVHPEPISACFFPLK